AVRLPARNTHKAGTQGFMDIHHRDGESISLTVPELSGPLWTFTYGSTPKPHFSSVRTPAGDELALVEPYDHLWHRGLWFTIKFVNGVNFWEERDEFGTQKIIGEPQVSVDDRAVTLTMSLEWIDRQGDVPITEVRRITWRHSGDEYTFDWRSEITASIDLTLDRTPFTTWGGYSGLSFRGNRMWHIDRYLLPGISEKPLPPGVRAPWCDLSGQFDGGPDRAGGIAIFDRPIDDAAPTPWYGGGNPAMNFLNAAFLFEGPQQLESGKSLGFDYRVTVHNGVWTSEKAEQSYQKWIAGERTGG
ncbi:MAG: PmoA family protein, partial [Thermomicrobiales bacterium]